MNRSCPSRALLVLPVLSIGCPERPGDVGEPGATNSEADPAPVRAGPPRLTLGGWTGEGQADFHDIAGVLVDRQAGVLVVANRGDATLRTFGLDGAWRGTRGGIGGGPREFGEMTALFGYRGDSLLVFDERRGDASVWAYADGDARRVAVPSLPEDGLRYPRLHGALADGRLVWTAEKPYGRPDEVGTSHPDTMLIFLTSAAGAGFAPVAETPGERRFSYAASIYRAGRAPFSPEAFVLPRDSVVLFGWTERPRARRASAAGIPLDPISFSLPSTAVAGPHRAWEVAERRRRLTARPLPPSLLEGQTAILDMLPFPDSFPVLGAVVAGEDGRTWVRGYRPPRTDSSAVEEAPAVWSVYAGPASRGRHVEFPAGFDLLWADGEEAVGVVRDGLDVERVLIVPLPATSERPPAPGEGDR